MTIHIKFLLAVLLVASFLAIPALAADTAVGDDDQGFVSETASGGLMEVELGKLAQKSAKSQEVKDFAATMVKDHGKANDELTQLVQKKQTLKISTALLSEHQSKIDKLQELKGVEFDQAYMQEMVMDHSKDVENFRAAGQKLMDPGLKAWAQKTLPVLERHLEKAKSVAQKVGVKPMKDK